MPVLRRVRSRSTEPLHLSAKAVMAKDWEALNSLVWSRTRAQQYAEYITTKRHSKRPAKR